MYFKLFYPRFRLADLIIGLFLLAVLLLCGIPARAQSPVPSYSQPPAQFPTYNAAFTFTPAVTASKDLLYIAGSASKLIRVTRLECDGVSTAAAATPVFLNKYTAAPTGGTAVTDTAVANDPLNAAATAVVKHFTAAPTNGTGGGAVRAGLITTVTAASTAVTPTKAVWDFSTRGGEQWGLVLRGAAQVVALTVGATALSAGTVLNCTLTWTEQ